MREFPAAAPLTAACAASTRFTCDARSIWQAAPARGGRDTLRRWWPLAPGSMQMALRPSLLAVPANRLEVLDPATGSGAMSLHASCWMNLHAQQAMKLIKLTILAHLHRCKSYNQIISWPAEREGAAGSQIWVPSPELSESTAPPEAPAPRPP